MFFVFNDDNEYEKFLLKDFSELPSNINHCVDDGELLKELVECLNINKQTLPVFIIMNDKNEVVFVKQGYTIGLGEQLLKTLNISFR